MGAKDLISRDTAQSHLPASPIDSASSILKTAVTERLGKGAGTATTRRDYAAESELVDNDSENGD